MVFHIFERGAFQKKIEEKAQKKTVHPEAIHRILEIPEPPCLMGRNTDYYLTVKSAERYVTAKGRHGVRMRILVEDIDNLRIPEDAPGWMSLWGATDTDKRITAEYLVAQFNSFCDSLGVSSPGLGTEYDPSILEGKTCVARFTKNEEYCNWTPLRFK